MATASDIQRLRQQAMFNIAPQMDMGGGMDMMGGGGYEPEPMNYAAPGSMGGRYTPPPMDDYGGVEPTRPGSPLDQIGQQPSTGPTFPSGSTIMPGQTPADPNKTAPGSTPLGTQTLQEYIDMINKGYTPDFTDRDRLRKLMDAAPVRESPSFARALVAGGLSIKAQDPIKAAEDVMYAPHRRNMTDWLAKTEPYYKTADLENRQNVNERTLMTGAITAKTQADRLAEQGRQADQKNEIARQRAENDAIRARAYAAKNNGYTVMKAGDRIVAVDPTTNRRLDLGPSGGLDRETELDILGEWNVKAAEARGAAAVQTAQAGAIANNRDVVTIDGITYRRQEDGSFAPAQGLPRGTPTRPGTPARTGTGAGARTNTLETRRQIQDRMAELWQTDPVAKKYIKRGAGGGYDWKDRPTVAEAGGIWPFNSDAVTQDQVDEYDQIRSEVDPTYKAPTRGLSPSAPPGGAAGRGAGAGRGGASAQPVKTQTDAANPQHKRGTFADGSVKESFDGGKTWK